MPIATEAELSRLMDNTPKENQLIKFLKSYKGKTKRVFEILANAQGLTVKEKWLLIDKAGRIVNPQDVTKKFFIHDYIRCPYCNESPLTGLFFDHLQDIHKLNLKRVIEVLEVMK